MKINKDLLRQFYQDGTVSKNFKLEEFVNDKTYKEFGLQSIRFIDLKLIDIAQAIRYYIMQPVIINGMIGDVIFDNSGYRDPDCEIGAFRSAHKLGKAIDIKIPSISKQEGRQLYDEILQQRHPLNEQLTMLGLTAVEDFNKTRTWIHLSVETRLEPGIAIL